MRLEGLYGIADATFGPPLELGMALLEAEVCALQVRCKGWPEHRIEPVLRILHPLCQRKGVPLIVNDHPMLAAMADGVHLGQDDGPIKRDHLASGCIVGRSTHTIEQALSACEEGADYLGFGPMFSTNTKETLYSPRGLEFLRSVVEAVNVPVVAIGGIKPEHVDLIQKTGATAWAPISGILACEQPAQQARLFSRSAYGKQPARPLQAESVHRGSGGNGCSD